MRHFSLCHNQFIVYAVVAKQFAVCSEFRYLAVIKYKQTVGVSKSGQTVCDGKCSPVDNQLVQRVLN